LGQHRVERPYGLEGGAPGAVAKAIIERVNGSIEVLPGIAAFDLQPWDRLRIETPGGGGFGSPGNA
jgi:5-oxoprolinase (ATP-hydrolysing)